MWAIQEQLKPYRWFHLYGPSHWQWGSVQGRTTFNSEQDADDEIDRRELVGEAASVFVGNKDRFYRLN